MDSRQLPPLDRTLTQAWQANVRAWRALLVVCTAGWVPFAVFLLLWLPASVNLDVLTASLLNPEAVFEADTVKVDTFVYSPTLLLAGTVVAIMLWVGCVCLVSGASAVCAQQAMAGTTPSALFALGQAGRKLPRVALVYLTLTFSGLLLVSAFLAVALGLPLLAVASGLPLIAAVGVGVVGSIAGAIGAAAAWLWLYARWALAGQAAVLDPPGRGNPLVSSTALTQGRRWGVLGRVLMISVIVALGVGTISTLFVVFNLGGTALIILGLALRMFTSLATSGVSNAGITPVYLAAREGTQK